MRRSIFERIILKSHPNVWMKNVNSKKRGQMNIALDGFCVSQCGLPFFLPWIMPHFSFHLTPFLTCPPFFLSFCKWTSLPNKYLLRYLNAWIELHSYVFLFWLHPRLLPSLFVVFSSVSCKWLAYFFPDNLAIVILFSIFIALILASNYTTPNSKWIKIWPKPKGTRNIYSNR